MTTMVQVSLTRTIPPPSYKTPILSPRPVRHISLPPAKPLDNPLSIFFPSIRLGSRSASPEYRPDAAPAAVAKPAAKRHRSSNSLDISPTRKKRILLERLMHRRPRPRSTGIWQRLDDSPAVGVVPAARRRDPSPLSLESLLNDDDASPIDSAAKEKKDKSDKGERPRKKRKGSESEPSSRRLSIGKTPKGTRPPPLNGLDKKEPSVPRPDRGLISPVVTGFPVHTADTDTLDSVSALPNHCGLR